MIPIVNWSCPHGLTRGFAPGPRRGDPSRSEGGGAGTSTAERVGLPHGAAVALIHSSLRGKLTDSCLKICICFIVFPEVWKSDSFEPSRLIKQFHCFSPRFKNLLCGCFCFCLCCSEVQRIYCALVCVSVFPLSSVIHISNCISWPSGLFFFSFSFFCTTLRVETSC